MNITSWHSQVTVSWKLVIEAKARTGRLPTTRPAR